MSLRNLLIVGHAYCGKSALANVLTDTKYFEENERAVRNTKDFQKTNFQWMGTEYHVVDIRFKQTEMYDKIGKIIKSMPKGISQVLFVVDERLSAEEIKMFELYEKAILKSGILKYTTVVRTKFSNFKNKDECNKDRNKFFGKSEKIANIINKCSIIYVDNPPINIDDDDDDSGVIKINKINKKRREKSRIILLDHLKKVCRGKVYKLKAWDKLQAEEIESAESISDEVKRILKESGVSEFVETIEKGNSESGEAGKKDNSCCTIF